MLSCRANRVRGLAFTVFTDHARVIMADEPSTANKIIGGFKKKAGDKAPNYSRGAGRITLAVA